MFAHAMSLAARATPPAPQTVGLGGGWSYHGCLPDSLNGTHKLAAALTLPHTLTAPVCLGICASYGYMAAGLGNGTDCHCGDPDDVAGLGGGGGGSQQQQAPECGVPCAGNASAACGGPDLLSTYLWTGDGDDRPYVFSYAADLGPGAGGSYDMLIGGVCIPLVTSQSVTGKVTFLEKSGTGPPNSTGAYELDLSLADGGEFGRCWREMHVQTDVFCSAAVTLPDKAGRHLSIGGWSGRSTQGVRLYWPDGAAGANGTNDWQENPAELALQRGRWYPSAAVLANGSVLVVGGQDGSSGPAEPSLELLPATGAPPLHLDWLAATSPWNLYPFLAVTPGRAILAVHHNQARLLQPDTFETIRSLPPIPAVVGSAAGGRTYPLQGSTVLLPQRAPYTDPIEVLVCGGAALGAAPRADALDNCVSIAPDVDGAAWAIERMPSPRVMPCIAPLPDGTYVMMNGARRGRAGFAAGSDPNLGAVLYDPARPLGRRMTVAANTTIARLYHSEAILLLDGRVLVTGSDPEDGVYPQEYRVETYSPPYLLSGRPRPEFVLERRDWAYGERVAFTLARAPSGPAQVSLLGAVSSTHGNSMGARTIFPAVECDAATECTVTAPPGPYVCPPGWYQFFVLDDGVPAVGVYVRIGGDPGRVGDWPDLADFALPGV